jgi:molybdate transport system substrate-binding protein
MILNYTVIVKRIAVIFVVALAGLLGVAGCRAGEGGRSGPPEKRVLSVAAASDLRFAMDELLVVFRKARPDTTVAVTYGSSGTFFAQIVNGAPFDVFLSADVTYPRQLADRGLALAGSEFTYALGRIVVWAPASSTLDIQVLGLRALTDPSVARVAIANPAHAPYGRAALAAIRSAGIYDAVAPKLVLGENIAQAFQFVQSGSADVGVVALSLAMAPPAAGGHYVKVPLEAHPPLTQGGLILKSTQHLEEAQAFRSLLTGAEGRAVLARFGLLPEVP